MNAQAGGAGFQFSKSRVNFLELWCSGDAGYRINDYAVAYMHQQGLSQALVQSVRNSPRHFIEDAAEWEKHLSRLGLHTPRHRRIATEALDFSSEVTAR